MSRDGGSEIIRAIESYVVLLLIVCVGATMLLMTYNKGYYEGYDQGSSMFPVSDNKAINLTILENQCICQTDIYYIYTMNNTNYKICATYKSKLNETNEYWGITIEEYLKR